MPPPKYTFLLSYGWTLELTPSLRACLAPQGPSILLLDDEYHAHTVGNFLASGQARSITSLVLPVPNVAAKDDPDLWALHVELFESKIAGLIKDMMLKEAEEDALDARVRQRVYDGDELDPIAREMGARYGVRLTPALVHDLVACADVRGCRVIETPFWEVLKAWEVARVGVESERKFGYSDMSAHGVNVSEDGRTGMWLAGW